MLKKRPREYMELNTYAKIKAELEQSGCKIDHPIIEFQFSLGGYTCVSDFHEIELGFSGADLSCEINNVWFFNWGYCPPAPYNLEMDEQGRLYRQFPGEENLFCSSITTFIENCAMEEWFTEIHSTGYFLPFDTTKNDFVLFEKEISASGFSLAPAASDNFTKAWLKDDFLILSMNPENEKSGYSRLFTTAEDTLLEFLAKSPALAPDLEGIKKNISTYKDRKEIRPRANL